MFKALILLYLLPLGLTVALVALYLERHPFIPKVPTPKPSKPPKLCKSRRPLTPRQRLGSLGSADWVCRCGWDPLGDVCPMCNAARPDYLTPAAYQTSWRALNELLATIRDSCKSEVKGK